MSKDKYYVIYGSEDGDATMDVLDATQLRKKLQDGYWGNPKFKLPDEKEFIDIREIQGLIIIRGEAFIPKAVKVETDWEL